jgi:dTDP-glucose 4,6-dehydratase
LVLHQGISGEVYNIGGNNEKTNIDIVKLILSELGKPESLIHYVEDRLGHDRRYGIDAAKISTELGWKPQYDFTSGIKKTIHWYLEHHDWLKSVAQK